jgi:hypothetical protein
LPVKIFVKKNTNLLIQAAIAIVIVVFASGYWLVSFLLGTVYALLIIDTKLNLLHSERLLGPGYDTGMGLKGADNFCILNRSGNGYNAIAVSAINTVRGVKLDGDAIESIISKSNFPFKFMVSIEKINTKSFIEKLLTKKQMMEIQLSRLDHSNPKANSVEARLKAEISYLGDEIKDFSSGGTPVKVHYYLIVSEYGENAYEAQNAAKVAIKQISSLFDSILGSTSTILKNAEIYKAIN